MDNPLRAPVFLSASEPDPNRSAEYWDSRKLLNVREAVRAFCAHTLGHFPVVYGGHPAITPLVKGVAKRIADDSSLDPHTMRERPRVLMFQSALFVPRKSTDEEIITEPIDAEGDVAEPGTGMRNESLLLMRYEMLGEPLRTPPLTPPTLKESYRRILHHYGPMFGTRRRDALGTENFSAAVFIGGMEGVAREFRIFRSFHPNTPAFPIASTGSACAALMEAVAHQLPGDIADRLLHETAYSLLMQKILPIGEGEVPWRVDPRRPVLPVSFEIPEHIDPEKINRRFPA